MGGERPNSFVLAALSLVLAVPWLIASPRPGQGTEPAPTAAAPRQVIAGIPRSWPPQYSLDPAGRPTGFAIDIMDRIAARAGIRVSYRVFDNFAAVGEAMQAGLIDLIPNSGMTAERRAEFLFSAPVKTFAVSVFVREDTIDIIAPENLAGRRVAVVEYNVGRNLMKGRPDIDLVVHRDAATALFELLSGRVDAMVFPQPVMWKLAREAGVERRIKMAGAPLIEIKRGIRLRKNEDELMAAINAAMEGFVGSPDYQAIYVKWYGQPRSFWTAARVAWTMGGVLALFLVTLLGWRHYSVVSLSTKLKAEIGDRNIAERALRESEERLTEAQRLARIGNWERLVDHDRYIWSDEMFRIFGYRPGEIEPTLELLMEHFHPDDREPVIKRYQQALEAGEDSFDNELRIIRSDGSQRVLLSHVVLQRDDQGHPIRFVGTTQDISERKQAEEARLESEQRFRAITEGSPAALVITRRNDGTILFANPKAGQVLGVPADDLPGSKIQEYFWYPEEREDRVRPLNGDRFIETAPLEMRRADGQRISTIHSLQTIRYQNNDAVLGAFHDVTERLQMEEQLRHAQKMEAVGQLTGGVAHDFNNMLQIITTNLAFLAEDIHGNPQQMEMIKTAQTATERGSQVTHGLLAFTRQQALLPEPLDIESFVSDTVRLLRPTLGETIAIETRIDQPIPRPLADRGHLQNALVNLAVNARDAMPNGGTLRLGVNAGQPSGRPPADEAAPGLDDYVVITVSDDGCGIPADVIERTTDPFFTTKGMADHSGLGLSMVLGFVRQSGGRLEIESEVGQGTTLRLYLPCAAADAAAADVVASETPATGHERILVVEDDAAVRQALSTMLQRLGYAVAAAKDGPEALKMLERQAHDLVVTDLIMPGGLRGGDLAARAREQQPEIRVVFISGYAEAISTMAGTLHDGDEVLGKPFSTAEMAAAIRRALDHWPHSPHSSWRRSLS